MFATTMSVLFAAASLFGLSRGAEPPTKRMRMDEENTIRVSNGLTIGGYTSNNRLIEYYNYTEISRVYSSRFAEALHNLTLVDERYDAFTPSTSLSFEALSENTPYGRIYLGRKIASSEESVLYEIRGNPKILIKYQANCVEIHPVMRVSEYHYVHPLINDYFFGRLASRIGVGPTMHYLSPPGRLCDHQEGKCAFKMDRDDFENCRKMDGVSLRFMIIERVRGENLWDFKERFKNGIVPLSASLAIADGILNGLARLHRYGGIVHGDFHINNIMLERFDNRTGTAAVKFIDYGRSFGNQVRVNETVRLFGWAHDSQFSSWELEGYEPAARDDVEKAVQVIAQLMMPWSYVEGEQKIAEHSPRSILAWKRNRNWFVEPQFRDDPKPVHDPIANLAVQDEIKAKMRFNFRMILSLVRGMTDINSVPPYDHLIYGFRATREFLNYSPLNTTTIPSN